MCQVVILASASNPNPSTLLQTHNGLTTIRIKRHKNPSQDKAFDCVSDSQRLIHITTAKHLHFCPFEFWQSVVTSWRFLKRWCAMDTAVTRGRWWYLKKRKTDEARNGEHWGLMPVAKCLWIKHKLCIFLERTNENARLESAAMQGSECLQHLSWTPDLMHDWPYTTLYRRNTKIVNLYEMIQQTIHPVTGPSDY